MSSAQDPRRSRGFEAEGQAAEWLERCGFEVLRRNWKLPRTTVQSATEIDILARRGGVAWVVEVKSARCVGHEVTELLSQSQRRRLYQAALTLSQGRLGRVRVALLWVHASAEGTCHFEWLENP